MAVAAVILAVAGISVMVGLSTGKEPEIDRADAADEAPVSLGRDIYRGECASCHGARLEGQPDWRSRLPDGGLPAPPHDETGHTWHHGDRQLFEVTKYGGARWAPPGFVSHMPGFGEKLSDREIWAALAFIKSTWPDHVRARQAAIDERMRVQQGR